MEAIYCPGCNANEYHIDGKYFVCDYCNTRFLPPVTAKTSEISLSDDVQRLLDKCKSDPDKAWKYANLILDIDPDNQEALQYL